MRYTLTPPYKSSHLKLTSPSGGDFLELWKDGHLVDLCLELHDLSLQPNESRTLTWTELPPAYRPRVYYETSDCSSAQMVGKVILQMVTTGTGYEINLMNKTSQTVSVSGVRYRFAYAVASPE